MRYYKIIQNDRVVGVGHQYLKWFGRVGMFCLCDIENAQCVQDAITGKLYQPEWLVPPPNQAQQPEAAYVQMIDPEEYDELFALLGGGEEVIVEEEQEPEPAQSQVSEAQEERPMTVAEMRERIQELEEVLNIIMGVVE